MEKLQCQAIMLMPESRNSYYRGTKMRCTFAAKPESSFCGVHAKLGAYIQEIVWKEEDELLPPS